MKFLKVVVLILSMTFIMACGKNKSDETYNIIWYGIGGSQEDTKKVFEEISKYTKEKINATVEYKTIDWGDYTQKMQVMASAGDEYDMAFTASWTGYSQLASKGAFMELDELAGKYAKETLASIDPRAIEGAKINGVLYAIPNNKEMAGLPIYRINQTYLDKYNLSLDGVKTLDDLIPLMEVVKKNEPGVVPFAVFANTNYGTKNLDFLVEPKIPGAVRVDNGDLKVINQFDDPEMIEAFKEYRKLYLKGLILKEAVSIADKSDLQQTGKWFVGRADYQPLAENGWEEGLGYKVKWIPVFPKPVMSTASVTGSMLAISANSKNPEKTMEFINLLNTDKKLRNMVDSGIEGVHFKLVGDDVFENLPDSKKYDMPSFSLGNMFLTYKLKSDPADKWEQFKKFNESAIESPLLGFTFDPEPVKNEIAAVKNISEEFGPALFLGAADTDSQLKVMNEKMKNAGSDKILIEMQKQIDTWKAKKAAK